MAFCLGARAAHLWLGLSLLLVPSVTSAESLRDAARGALVAALREEQGWVRVHAAEALVTEGESALVSAALPPAGPDASWPRVGYWRVRAMGAGSAEDRAVAVRQVIGIWLEPRDPAERLQALESLCKLREPLTGPTLAAVRRATVEGPEAERVFAWWALALTPGDESWQRLVLALAASDPAARIRAAHALRWLRLDRAEVRTALSDAADREPAGTAAEAYVLSAAFLLVPAAPHAAVWRKRLEYLARRGSWRIEPSVALMEVWLPAEVAALRPALAEKGDERIAAAWSILHVSRRP